MRLKEIFPELNLESSVGELKPEGINRDSRNVEKNDLFFVIEGRTFDVFSVVAAIEDKVIAFICEGKNKSKIGGIIFRKPVIFVKDINKEFFKAIDIFYRVKKNKFKFIGVTGTNGKTTTAHFIYQFLKKMEEPVSLIGTVNYYIGSKVYPARHTTPEYLSLMKMLSGIGHNKEGTVVMEVSSHGIDQGRIEGIDFQRCVFTNLTRDHLDYHKTMAKYFAAKRKLFFHNKQAVGIINIDDFYGRKLFNETATSVTYGVSHKADVMAVNIQMAKEAASFSLVYRGKAQEVKAPVLGLYNVYNILAAGAAILSLGWRFGDLCEFIPSLKSVKGRLQRVDSDIFVDYAHTPDALACVLSVLRQVGYKNIISVFGCGGDRDKGKRLLMGRIASLLSDFSVVTSDNPRGEQPYKICSQIIKGFRNKNYTVIVDRKDAIKKAVSMKRKYKDCCLLLAGKGHEDYQIIGDKKIEFSDLKVITEEVENQKQF